MAGLPQIDISEKAGVRYLHFGSNSVQGAMRIRRPQALELEYTRELLFPLLLNARPDWPVRILQIGLGVGALARFLHRHFPGSRQEVVELHPGVVAACQHYFPLPPASPRFRLHLGDGAEFLRETAEHYDLILVDGFLADGDVGTLDGDAFFASCLEKLQPQGWLALNLLGRNPDFPARQARLAALAGERLHLLPASPSGNVIALLGDADSRLDPAQLAATAQELQQRTGLDLAPTIARLARA